MPRKPRLIEDLGYYHIITRGNNRQKIFRCEQDFMNFFKLCNETLDKHPLLIHHYCFMSNHIHFVIRVLKATEVPKFFQVLLQRYASYFKKQYCHTGFLFQNRYKSYLIDKESYLLECGRYVERNPVRAGIVSDSKEYRWSSYAYYTYGEKDRLINEANPLYLTLAQCDSERKKLYREYILEERPYESILDKAFNII